jgi:hypothetical protein
MGGGVDLAAIPRETMPECDTQDIRPFYQFGIVRLAEPSVTPIYWVPPEQNHVPDLGSVLM